MPPPEDEYSVLDPPPARSPADATDDAEARLDALRNFQQAAIFRVAVVDLTGVLPLMKVSDRLTDEAWHSMLASGEVPARPDWISPTMR